MPCIVIMHNMRDLHGGMQGMLQSSNYEYRNFITNKKKHNTAIDTIM